MALALNLVKSLCIHGNCDKKTGWVVLDLTLLQPQSTQIIVVKEELKAMCVSTYVSLVKFHVELGFFNLLQIQGKRKLERRTAD